MGVIHSSHSQKIIIQILLDMESLNAQSEDIRSNNLCIDPSSIYPDSYPHSECKSKPIIYCLPFSDSSQCPQFQMTANSMYNNIDFSKDLIDIYNFYECECWYKANDEGDANNDQQISVHMDFNENCRQIQQQKEDELN